MVAVKAKSICTIFQSPDFNATENLWSELKRPIDM